MMTFKDKQDDLRQAEATFTGKVNDYVFNYIGDTGVEVDYDIRYDALTLVFENFSCTMLMNYHSITDIAIHNSSCKMPESVEEFERQKIVEQNMKKIAGRGYMAIKYILDHEYS